jgi:hypothetical protein
MTENKCESNHVRSKGSANEGFSKTGAGINDVHKEKNEAERKLPHCSTTDHQAIAEARAG